MKGLRYSVGVFLALSVLTACKKGGGSAAHALVGLGKPVAEGAASDLRLSPNGAWAAFLHQGQKPRMDGLPVQMLVGELHVASTALPPSSSSRKVGTGVTNVPGGWIFSPNSEWIYFLADYQAAGQVGKLTVAGLKDGSDPVVLGNQVSYVLVSPDSKQVAFVDGGVLKVGPTPKGPFKDVSGEVALAHFAPKGSVIAYKRKLSAAGGMFVLKTDDPKATPKKLGEQAGEFKFSPDGKLLAFNVRSTVLRNTYDLQLADLGSMKTVPVGQGVEAFEFSPDGKYLARTEGQKPELLGNLVVGPAQGGPGKELGERAYNFVFSPDSTAIAFLGTYDKSASAGVITVATLPEGVAKRIAGRVPNFTWGSDGQWLAFLERFIKPIFSVNLMLYKVGEDKPALVHEGVFGYGFTPKNERLLFRSNCIREGRACDLFSLDMAQPKPPARKLMEGIYSFKTCPTGVTLLVSYAQVQADAYDVASFTLPTNKHQMVDRNIALPAVCVNEQGSAVAYIVKGSKAGVYVATP